MARAEELNSANSQFFIMLAPRFALDRRYSGFGRVIEGMAFVDAIAVGEPPADPTRIVRATIGGPLPAPPVVAAAAPAATPAASTPAALPSAPTEEGPSQNSGAPAAETPAATPGAPTTEPAVSESAPPTETPPQEAPQPQ